MQNTKLEGRERTLKFRKGGGHILNMFILGEERK